MLLVCVCSLFQREAKGQRAKGGLFHSSLCHFSGLCNLSAATVNLCFHNEKQIIKKKLWW